MGNRGRLPCKRRRMDEKLEQIKQKHKSRLKKIFSLRNRLMMWAGICGILLAFCIVPGGIPLLRNTIYSFLPISPKTLILPADPYKNGKIHGQKRKFSINLLCDMYLKRIVCWNRDDILKERSALAEKLFAAIDPRWTEEIRGLSDGCEVSKSELMLANSFLDIGQAHVGCRQVVLDAKGIDPKQPQRVMHAHNLDWDNLGGVGNFLVTIFRKEAGDGRFATVRMGFPGLIGALTIINEKGISLGFDQVGSAREESKMPIFIQMRNIAETCSNFAEADQILLNMPQGMPFCIVLVDAKTGQAAVYERLRSQEINKREIVKGVLTADNSTWFGRDMSGCSVDQVAREKSRTDCNPETMQSILRDNRVLLGCNIYSVIFDFSNNDFYLAAGKVPAANGKYVKYKLFEKKE